MISYQTPNKLNIGYLCNGKKETDCPTKKDCLHKSKEQYFLHKQTNKNTSNQMYLAYPKK